MGSARAAHTATLLPNGKVLMAGGYNGVFLPSAETYDYLSGTWTPTGNLNTGRDYHKDTLLPNGQVLVSGGWNGASIASGETYDPATGSWTVWTGMKAPRNNGGAVLLPDGRVLVAGGFGAIAAVESAEVFDNQLGWTGTWKPTITNAASPLFPGKVLSAAGTGFRGYHLTEGSGGTYSSSATNYPLVRLCRLDNQQVRWLNPDQAHPFTETAFTSTGVTGFPVGHALLTVFVNGIPSESKVIVLRDFFHLYLPQLLKN
jgi:hypothetical protein